MEIVKRENFAVQRFEEKKSILESPLVQSKLSPGEFRIAKLSLARTIGDLPESEIKIVKGEPKDVGAVKQIGILSVGICKDYAIRNPDKAEGFRFYDILRKYYSEFTISEVRTAFELALVGSLDEYLPKDKNGNPDKNSYQSFSVEFITKILNAYKKYKGRVWSKVYLITAKEEKEVTEEEKDKILADFKKTLAGFYEEYLETGLLSIHFPNFIAEYLVKNGMAEPKELEAKHFNRARAVLGSSDKSLEEKKKIFFGFEQGNYSEGLESEARRVLAFEIIRETFDRLKNEGIQNDYWD